MHQAILALCITVTLSMSAAMPVSAAEFKKAPAENAAANAQLRSTPDIDDGNGDVNTDPAMTPATGKGRSTANGNTGRSGGGQSYPNADTDNPAGFQPCPQ